MKQCKIQIIEENILKRGFGNIKVKWIALLKDIDFKNKTYSNVVAYNLKDPIFFAKLFKGKNHSVFASWDVIRNPTIEEMIELSCAAKEIGIKINLKTGNYTYNKNK